MLARLTWHSERVRIDTTPLCNRETLIYNYYRFMRDTPLFDKGFAMEQ